MPSGVEPARTLSGNLARHLGRGRRGRRHSRLVGVVCATAHHRSVLSRPRAKGKYKTSTLGPKVSNARRLRKEKRLPKGAPWHTLAKGTFGTESGAPPE